MSAQAGNRDAYGELVMRHHAPVYASLYHMTADRDRAEDATQQAFVQAWLHLPVYRQKSSFRSWLMRIAMNACMDDFRREKRIHPDETALEETRDPLPEPEKRLILKQRAQSIQNALLGLNDTSRNVLVLREYGDLSYQEIATTLEIPLGTVMSRLNTARRQLRDALKGLLDEMEI